LKKLKISKFKNRSLILERKTKKGSQIPENTAFLEVNIDFCKILTDE